MSAVLDFLQFAMKLKVGQRVPPARFSNNNPTGGAGETHCPTLKSDKMAGETHCPTLKSDKMAGETHCPTLAPIQLGAFTLIELLVVIALIGLRHGLIVE